MKSILLCAIFLCTASLSIVCHAQSELPPPTEGKIYTLEDLEAAKFDLEGKVVKVRIAPTIFKPEQVSKEEFKVFVEDAPKGGKAKEGFAYIYFPREGLQKMNLLGKTPRGSMSFYVLVTPDKFRAVGRSTSKDMKGKVTYVW